MFNKEKPVQFKWDENSCTKCKKCIVFCPADYLIFENEKIKVNEQSPFGCIQCGLCMINCPKNCIEINAESISKEYVFELEDNKANFDSVKNLLEQRRSIRKFKKLEISKEIIEKILQAASTAPISIPPSEVKVLVINNTKKVQEFANKLVPSFKSFLNIFNPFTLMILKLITGKTNYKVIRDFVLPLFNMTIEESEQGKDILFYNAPAVIIFYGKEDLAKEDSIIAASYLSIVAESLGLGTCIIGSVPPILQHNKKLKAEYEISKDEKPYISIILGYPESKPSKGIKRNFKKVNYKE